MCGPGTRHPDGGDVPPRGAWACLHSCTTYPDRPWPPFSFSNASSVVTWLPWLCVTEDNWCLEMIPAVTARGRVLRACCGFPGQPPPQGVTQSQEPVESRLTDCAVPLPAWTPIPGGLPQPPCPLRIGSSKHHAWCRVGALEVGVNGLDGK